MSQFCSSSSPSVRRRPKGSHPAARDGPPPKSAHRNKARGGGVLPPSHRRAWPWWLARAQTARTRLVGDVINF
ncbi:hypothetical protein NL676_007431 [Syzygium grande]|nr:hypothetical protein NL676_007431 [Syzygium grande]